LWRSPLAQKKHSQNDIPMHWLTLGFSAELEARYKTYFLARFLPYIRIALFLGFFIYAAFGVMDYYLAPHHYLSMWKLRFGLGVPVVLGCLLLTYSKFFQRYLHLGLAATSFVASAVLIALISVAPKPVDSTYYAGFMLVLYFSYTFVRMRAFHAAIAGWASLLLYGYVAIDLQRLDTWVLVNNISFLFSANIIGMVACYFIERQSRNNFLHLERIEEETARTDAMNNLLASEIRLRRQNEEKIRQSEQALRTIFDAVDAALFIHQPDGTVENVNEKMLEMYQATRDEVIGTGPDSAPPPPSDNPLYMLQEIYSRALQGESLRFEWKGLRQHDQEEFDVEVSLKKIALSGEDKLLATVHDITDRKRAEALRADMERMSRHDLKGPLGIIVSLPEVLLEELDGLSEEQVKLLKRIEEAGYRMLDMINLSLDMYKMEHDTYDFTPAPLDLAQVTSKVMDEISLVSRGRNMRLTLMINGEPDDKSAVIFFSGEELLLYAMFNNLIKNGLEASADGEELIVALDEEDDMVRISVSNSGEVPFEIRNEFFNKYKTFGKKEGTGLGTYSVRLIAKVHGGMVKLDTRTSGRTTVMVLLPRSQG
ncbi:MAG: PAS domain-containing sensor histidine kinase, partial [Proteobacteria bacterium]|nr:PAS domain-containing sensor histidine kinase [Pseudomonadota bacterium]